MRSRRMLVVSFALASACASRSPQERFLQACEAEFAVPNRCADGCEFAIEDACTLDSVDLSATDRDALSACSSACERVTLCQGPQSTILGPSCDCIAQCYGALPAAVIDAYAAHGECRARVAGSTAACGGSTSAGDGGSHSGSGVYAACASSTSCATGLSCLQAFSGEPRFCGATCTGSSDCTSRFGSGWECQSTDEGGICTQLCSSGACPAPSHCRGATCQVF